MEEKQTRPLSTVKTGQTAKLVSIDAGRGLKSRLAAMGLLPQVEIKVLNNDRPGPFVISVKGSKMMLGRGITQKITVL